jgi:hypothetical protein
MRPDNVGTWLFHCHVTDHMAGGMMTRYRSLNKDWGGPGASTCAAEPLSADLMTGSGARLELMTDSKLPLSTSCDLQISLGDGWIGSIALVLPCRRYDPVSG